MRPLLLVVSRWVHREVRLWFLTQDLAAWLDLTYRIGGENKQQEKQWKRVNYPGGTGPRTRALTFAPYRFKLSRDHWCVCYVLCFWTGVFIAILRCPITAPGAGWLLSRSADQEWKCGRTELGSDCVNFWVPLGEDQRGLLTVRVVHEEFVKSRILLCTVVGPGRPRQWCFHLVPGGSSLESQAPSHGREAEGQAAPKVSSPGWECKRANRLPQAFVRQR